MRHIHRPRPLRTPSARLLCFPHGGRGPSMYRPWVALLPPDVELCAVSLPGRESRFDEPVPTDLSSLVDDVEASMPQLLDGVPVAFLGHSLGALLAVELGRRLAHGRGSAPCHMVVSGCRPPQDPDPMAGMADLSDAGLMAELRRLGGTAPELLGNPEAMELLLPTVRADLRLAERYRLSAPRVLRCPITVLAGDADPERAALDVTRWSAVTSGSCTVRRFPGGHFFIEESRPLVVAAAVQTLLPYLR